MHIIPAKSSSFVSKKVNLVAYIISAMHRQRTRLT